MTKFENELRDEIVTWAEKKKLNLSSIEKIVDDCFEYYKGMKVSKKKRSNIIKRVKTQYRAKQVSSGVTMELEATILGYLPSRVFNEETIKNALTIYEKDGSIPEDREGRPRIEVNIETGEPVVVGYSTDGMVYPLKARNEQAIAAYAGPSDSDERGLVRIVVGGVVSESEESDEESEEPVPEEKWLVDVIEAIPVGKTVLLNARIVERTGRTFINLSRDKVSENGFFEVVDDEPDLRGIMQEIENHSSFIQVIDIGEFIDVNSNTLFVISGSIASVGEPGQYGSYNVTIVKEQSDELDDSLDEVSGDDKDNASGWLANELEPRFEALDDVYVVGEGYYDNKKALKVQWHNVIPLSPIEPEVIKGREKPPKRKKKSVAEKIVEELEEDELPDDPLSDGFMADAWGTICSAIDEKQKSIKQIKKHVEKHGMNGQVGVVEDLLKWALGEGMVSQPRKGYWLLVSEEEEEEEEEVEEKPKKKPKPKKKRIKLFDR